MLHKEPDYTAHIKLRGENKDIIHIRGTFNKKKYAFSTKKKATKVNLDWVKKNTKMLVFAEMERREKKRYFQIPQSSLESYGRNFISSTADRRKANQQRDLLSQFERLIIPYFKEFELDDIRAEDIEAWQKMLFRKKTPNGKFYSSASINRVSQLFNRILRRAAARRVIPVNPFDGVDTIRVTYKESVPYTLEEARLIMKEAKGWLKVYIITAFGTGFRPSELIGLKWADIDFENKKIDLQRAITKGEITGTTITKNHQRLTPLPKEAIEVLKKHKKQAKSEWVFPSTRGNNHWYDANGVLRHFKQLLIKIGVEYKEFKVTRNTYTSILRNNGVSADLVTEIIGHSKEVSDKHYYKNEINEQKVKEVQGGFNRAKFFVDIDTNIDEDEENVE